MPIDPQTLGVAAAQFMEALESKHGADADLDAFALVAVVTAGDQTTIEFRFCNADGSDMPVHVVRGLLAEMDRGVTQS